MISVLERTLHNTIQYMIRDLSSIMPDLPVMYCTDVQYTQCTKNSLDLLCLFACVGTNKEVLEAVQKQMKRKAMDSLDKNVVGP